MLELCENPKIKSQITRLTPWSIQVAVLSLYQLRGYQGKQPTTGSGFNRLGRHHRVRVLHDGIIMEEFRSECDD